MGHTEKVRERKVIDHLELLSVSLLLVLRLVARKHAAKARTVIDGMNGCNTEVTCEGALETPGCAIIRTHIDATDLQICDCSSQQGESPRGFTFTRSG